MVARVNPFSPDGYGNSRQGNSKMGGENTDILRYQGHGRIESYPMNLNMAYVTGHERGHANSNRLEALAKNKTVEQDISYKLTLTKHGMVAEGVTRQTATISAPAGSLDKIKAYSSALSGTGTNSGLNISAILLKSELSKLKNEQLNPSRSSQKDGETSTGNPPLLSDAEETDQSSIGSKPELLKGKNNSSEVLSRIKELEGKIKDLAIKSVVLSDLKDKNAQSPQDSGSVREDHIDLTRGSELALQSHLSSITGVPPLEAVGYGSSFQYQSVMSDIGSYNNFSVLNSQREIDPSRLQAVSKFWTGLRDKLTSLQTATEKLASFSNYLNSKSSSYTSSFVQLTPSVQSIAETYKIDVTQRVQNQKVQSDVLTNADAAQGLSGSFVLNGTTINVIASDTINDIIDKINWGEDRDKNGILNYAEDVNGNGTLETYVTGGSSGSYLYINEDSNRNGINDGTEDANGNDTLDGGTKEHGVLAALEDSRLTLTYQGSDNQTEVVFSGGESAFSLLASLGLMTQTEIATGNTSSLFQYSLKNETASQDAVFSVDGTSYTRTNNTVTDVIAGASLEIKAPTPNTQILKVEPSIDTAVSYIKEFVATFNDAMQYMNDAMGKGKSNSSLMRGDLELNRVRKEVIDSVLGGNFPDNKNIALMEAIGITPGKSSSPKISFVTAKHLADTLSQNHANGNGAPDFPVSTKAAKAVPVGTNSVFEALSTANVGSLSDHNLSYDIAKVEKSVKQDPQGIFDTFNNKEVGFVPLLSSRLTNILDQKSGTIANEQNVIDMKIQRGKLTDSTTTNQQSLETTRRLKAFTNNFLSQYRSYTLSKSLGSLSISV